MGKFELTEEQLKALRRHQAKVMADPNTLQILNDRFSKAGPPSPFEGPQCGETGKVLSREEYRARVALNRERLRKIRAN